MRRRARIRSNYNDNARGADNGVSRLDTRSENRHDPYFRDVVFAVVASSIVWAREGLSDRRRILQTLWIEMTVRSRETSLLKVVT